MSKQVSRGSAGEYQSDERAGVTRLRRASICISRPPAPPGSIWSSAGLRCSLNANCAGAYTPVSEPSRLPSGPILLTPTRTPCPSYGQRPPTKSWPVSPDFVSGLQRQDTRERLINSRFHEAICFSVDQDGPSAGNPLVRERLSRIPPPSGGPRPRPLGCRQQVPACYIQIRQAATDRQPVRILREPPVPHFGPPEDPLDHQEHMLDFGTNLRLRPIAGPLRLAQGPMAMGFRLDEALGMGSMVLNHVALPAIGGIAPYSCLLSMQQLRQHLAVMDIRRRGRH